MATYKVPQDVEAEDKLLGPFGFRQFIYLAIAGGAGFVTYILFGIFPVLAIIPLPIVALFVILALPLRKEQPMETYVLALIRFYLKPKRRLWNPDGTITYVEIVAPKTVDKRLAKDFGPETASERIDYLARVMDSRGWALKGTTNAAGINISNEIMAEAQSAVDVFDEGASLSQSFSSMIAQKDQQRREQVVAQMQRTVSQAAARAPSPAATLPTPHFNPYPTQMHQRVITPIGQQAPVAAPTAQPATQAAQPSTTPAGGVPDRQTAPAITSQPTVTQLSVPQTVSPDIMRLARNDDLSISAIAREAHRLRDGDDEVVIKLH